MDIGDDVIARVKAGEHPDYVIRSYTTPEDRLEAFEAIARIPLPQELRSPGVANWILSTLFVLLTVLYVFALVDSLLLGEEVVASAIGVIGNGVVVYALLKRRVWVYIGIPVWMGFVLFGELRGLAATDESDPFLAYAFLAFTMIAGIVIWLSVYVRRALFPYVTFRGLKRDRQSRIILPPELRI